MLDNAFNRALIVDATDDFKSVFGVSATFTAADTSTTEIIVFFEETNDYQISDGQATTYVQTETIEYLIDDLGRVAVQEETFTIGGTVYVVWGTINNNGIYHKVAVR